MKIIGTGLSGLVGSRLVELLSEDYTFTDLSLETGVDITNSDEVYKRITNADADYVWHLAAKTDVDACEREKDQYKKSQAWKVNVLGTQHIVRACQDSRKRLLYVSTDFVFDGTSDVYSEADRPNPVNFYGLTKYAGEKIVQSLGELATICRISFPYRVRFSAKLDLVRAILSRLMSGGQVVAITDQLIVPTFIDDIAHAFDFLVKKNVSGIFHVVGGEEISPYALALKIAEVFSLDSRLIRPTTRAIYFQGRAYRPFKTSLNNDKIRSLGIVMRGLSEALSEFKKAQS